MLQLSASLINRPVLSLRTGGNIAHTVQALINPNNLKIEGFYCADRLSNETLVLLAQDIRDFIKQGIVVNDHDVLTDPAELVRLKNVIDLNFEMLGKPVYTVTKERVGKVQDFAADGDTLFIQKLYVGQSLLKSLGTGQLSIDRTQIVEITNKKIIIQEILKPVKTRAPLTAPVVG